MSDEQRDALRKEDHEMLKEVHNYLFVPTRMGQPPRGEEIDDALAGFRALRWFGRSVKWSAGLLAAGVLIYGQIKGWLTPK